MGKGGGKIAELVVRRGLRPDGETVTLSGVDERVIDVAAGDGP